jgi:phosphoadenosine phosphosulfate reductase
MSLIEHDLFRGRIDKVQMAIDRLRAFEPAEGYYGCFSGGKDSCVIWHLSVMAEVKVDWHYHLTTVDPPELVHFIKKHFPFIKVERPEMTMWQLIRKNRILPTRTVRYCCRVLKEQGGAGRLCITGIRQKESKKRSKRNMTERCMTDATKTFLHPIVDWEEADVWEYIHSRHVVYSGLYTEGMKRIGCVCCPNANQKEQAKRWPKIASAYKRAAIRAFNARERTDNNFSNGEQMYDWWIHGCKGMPEEDGGLFT